MKIVKIVTNYLNRRRVLRASISIAAAYIAARAIDQAFHDRDVNHAEIADDSVQMAKLLIQKTKVK